MFHLLRKKPVFIFDVNISSKPFEADLSKKEIEIIQKFHRRQKRTVEKFSHDIARKCKCDLKGNLEKIRTSCLELCALYYHLFSNEFEKNKTETAISRLYFSTIYHNFSDLEEKLKDLEYFNIGDFLQVKRKYFSEIHDGGSRLALSQYYYHTFARYPLMQPENYKSLPPFFDYIDSWQNYMFFLDVTGRIHKEAKDMSKALILTKPVHLMAPRVKSQTC